MKIRALIVDDEPLGRSLIRKLLSANPDFENVGECADGAEALHAIQNNSPDLVFLDVQMPQLNGFELLAMLPKEQLPVVIFVTAFDSFALKAFQAHALDYLLKPIDEDRFSEALRRVKIYLAGQETNRVRDRLAGLLRELNEEPKFISRLAVENAGRFVFLRVEEIDWIEAEGNYLKLHVGKQSYLLRGRISEMEKNLSPDQFFRVHRSTIVNLDRIKEFQPLFKGEGRIVLKDGSQVFASRNCSQKLHALLGPKL